MNSQPQRPPKVLAAAFTEGIDNIQIGAQQYSFQGLTYAQQEVETIAALMPNTTVLLGRDFTPEAIVPRFNDYTIIHLATSAVVIPSQPEESFILFGNGDYATLSEVRNWNLSNVDLVVLSACDTAVGGQLWNGEEILGLGYQMQQAGAKSVIASLWLIDDQGTQILMDAFYTALRNGNTPTAALRQAQIAC